MFDPANRARWISVSSVLLFGLLCACSSKKKEAGQAQPVAKTGDVETKDGPAEPLLNGDAAPPLAPQPPTAEGVCERTADVIVAIKKPERQKSITKEERDEFLAVCREQQVGHLEKMGEERYRTYAECMVNSPDFTKLSDCVESFPEVMVGNGISDSDAPPTKDEGPPKVAPTKVENPKKAGEP